MSYFQFNQINKQITCTYPFLCTYWDDDGKKCIITKDKQCPLEEEEKE